MLFKATLLSLLPLALANPQYYGPAPDPTPATTSSSAAPSPSGQTLAAQQIIVQVAPGSFTFSPSDIQAAVGTLVTFAFPGGLQHSVTQSNFGSPCTPLQGGFDSGLVGTAGVTYSINITDASTPIYFFCKFPGHCGEGMVGTINAPSGSANGSFSTFQAAAEAIGANEPNVPDNGPQTGGVGADATAAPMTGTPSVAGAAPSSTSGSSPSSSPSPTSNGATQLTLNAGMGLMALAAGAALAL